MDYVRHFETLVKEQLARVERMKAASDPVSYAELSPIVIGVLGGDGIGPVITEVACRIMEYSLKDELASGKVEIRKIDGLTIENRAKAGAAIPEEVLTEIRQCHVLLKGPTTTPRAGDEYPNIESANVAMRKELDLFANVRPVQVPDEGIDWTFFRENTEGAYVLGSKGIEVTADLAFDFKVITSQGAERIARAAFEFARKNGKTRVTAVTKANVIKTTDGKFLVICKEVAKEYPEITFDDWYIDIMTAKLIDKKRRTDFQVFILPNLYGDILTDEAAEFQGGVGTAGSANIGSRYAMFEAIHGSAPRMVAEGREIYADPSSMIRAAAMLLAHIGYPQKAAAIYQALEKVANHPDYRLTGRADGVTNQAYGEYIMRELEK
ncbi:isocitrate/isopropylmalate dehydrogenase family protein [Clostridiales bacterium COT073_COT-073]|nr:isocitrate/isopropylmalate dehydrogenase family protein [Clostridiales bacterium COT073_COT-073]